GKEPETTADAGRCQQEYPVLHSANHEHRIVAQASRLRTKIDRNRDGCATFPADRRRSPIIQSLDSRAAIGAIYGRDGYDRHLAGPRLLGRLFLVDAPHFGTAGCNAEGASRNDPANRTAL